METPTGTKENELTMLVGTYTSGDSKGIYSFRFNEETGTATALSETEVENPSYLAVSADGKFIYTVSEFNNEQAAANAFAFNQEKGTLKLLNSQKTGGEDPCYIITNGNNVITANYSGGSISVFPIAKDGSLLPASDIIKFEGSGTDKERQEKSHLHCVRITPDGKYMFADNLGTDQIHKFIINPDANAENKESFLKEGSPSAFKVKAGSGPRHLHQRRDRRRCGGASDIDPRQAGGIHRKFRRGQKQHPQPSGAGAEPLHRRGFRKAWPGAAYHPACGAVQSGRRHLCHGYPRIFLLRHR